MSKILYFLFLISVLGFCVYAKECPSIKTVSNFKASSYLGKWYEIQRYPQVFELETRCVTATYSLNPNGTVDVFNQAIMAPNTSISIRGTATPNPSNPANLTVHFPGMPFEGKYWVIDTDYTNYSLVYSCSLDLLGQPIESSWILSRKPELPAETITKLTSQLSAVKSATNLFKKTDQTGCH